MGVLGAVLAVIASGLAGRTSFGSAEPDARPRVHVSDGSRATSGSASRHTGLAVAGGTAFAHTMSRE